MPNNVTDFKNMQQLLNEAQTIAIAMHVRPDGDCIGTAAALRLSLIEQGKDVSVFIDSGPPSYLDYVDGIQTFIVQESDETVDQSFDLLVIVDTCDKQRIGGSKHLLTSAKKTLMFDHHLNPTMPVDTLVSNPNRSSTGEMMFEYFVKHGVRITGAMAAALYTAISSDTGCFLFPNTTAYSHHAASELLKIGIDLAHINYQNFRVYDPKKLYGLQRVLDNITFINDGRIAVTYLSYYLVQKFKFTNEDRHLFQKFATDASGVQVSLCFTEQEKGTFNVSLRSHGNVNVAQIAGTFGGGGHKNAAGVTMEGRYKYVMRQLVAEVEKHLVT